MAMEKCVKQIGAAFTVFTKLHHVSSSNTVKVFYLYYIYPSEICSSMNWKTLLFAESHPCIVPGDINNSRGDCSDFCFPVPMENTTRLTRKCGCPFGKS